MAENREAVLSQRVALGKHSIQTWEQEAHVCAVWPTSGGARPGLPRGKQSRRGGLSLQQELPAERPFPQV